MLQVKVIITRVPFKILVKSWWTSKCAKQDRGQDFDLARSNGQLPYPLCQVADIFRNTRKTLYTFF